MRADLEHRIAAVARHQQGVVTRAQLLQLGLGPGAVRHRVRTGRLRRLHRGVYLVGPIMVDWTREMAAVLACGTAAVLSHRSAAVLWRLATSTAASAPVDVSVPGGHNTDRPGIRVRRVRELEPGERTERAGVPVTSPGRTLVDLAAVAGNRELEQAVAHAQREGLVDPNELAGLVARYRGRPGMPRLRAVLAEEGGPSLTRSEAEIRFLALLRTARLPAPETNARIAGCEVDFLWRAEGVAVEVDGYRYHASRPRFESDRRRATHLAAHGVTVIPVTWRQIVDDGVATAVQVGRALLRRSR